ncbi:MAG: DUF4175 family protein [Pseudomonadota bacterium]
MADLNSIPFLSAKIGATRRGLGRLSFVRAFWPFLLFISIFLVSALLGLFQQLSAPLAAGLSVGAFLASLLLFMRAWPRWHRPAEPDAIAALEKSSPLRPITGLKDRPAAPTKDAQSLWQVHSRRLGDAARRLSVPGFHTEWRALDPAFMRYALPGVLVVSAVVAGPNIGERLQSAFQPDLGALVGADDIRIEAWITPPRHTGRAPVFLDDGLNDVRVPAGSEVTLRAFNRSAPRLVLSDESGRETSSFVETPDGAWEITTTLETDTRVAVHFWGEQAGWNVLTSPDLPPSVRFVSLPALTTKDELEFDWEVLDDFGIQRLELAVRLKEPHLAALDAEDRLPVPMGPILPKEAEGKAELETQRHRWAGLDVDLQLVAIDGGGQESRSETYSFTLPEKLLLQPLAKAAQEVRVTVLREPRGYDDLPTNTGAMVPDAVNADATQRLDFAPPDVQSAAAMLDALTYQPEGYFEDPSVYFGLTMANGILMAAPDKAEADSVDWLLWNVALKAEYGSSADALRALLAARRALEQALRDGASEDEIRRLMEAFREAANNYIAAKMAEAMMNGNEAPNMTDMGEMGGGPNMGANDFEDMLNALEDLAETGASDQARQLLSDITNLLENLEFQQGGGQGEGGFPMPGEGGEGEDGERPEGEQQLTDALERLSELLREQRELNDDTLAEQRGEGPGQQQGGQPGESEGEGGEGSLADRQRGLSDETGQLADGETGENGSGGGEPSDSEDGAGGSEFGALDEATRRRLEEISRLQEQAARELERGGTARAGRSQDQAAQELRELSNELAQRLDELEAARLGEDGTNPQDAVDPFGRPLGGAGDGNDITIPEEAERQRAKDILDELRRRYDNTDDESERDYLERLLDRF